MSDISYRHSLQILCGKADPASGQITSVDFEIDPAELQTIQDYNETLRHRYIIPGSAVDVAMAFGTVTLGKLLILQPTATMSIKFINTLGTSPAFTFAGGRTSLIQMEFTGLLFTNPTVDALKGVYFLCGD